MKEKIIETISKMSDKEIENLYEYLFGTGATQDEKIDADVKMLEKKFGVKVMQEMEKICIGTVVGIDTLSDFVKYRNEIKKPLKTARPLKAYAQEIIKISNAGLDARCAIEIMKQHEWQTLNIDWIKKKMPQVATGADLAQFGFEPQNTQRLIK